MTGDAVADSLQWSPSKVSRIETARIGTRLSDVDRLLDLFEVDDSQREDLLALAMEAAKRGWWEDLPTLGAGYAEFIALESEASAIRQWENGVVPGLLQTEAYARHVVNGWNVVATLPPREIERRLEVRMRRQQVLHQAQPPEMVVVLDEAVLLRRVGDAAVMLEQVDHLLSMAMLPHISLRILKLDGAHPVLAGSFTLLEFTPVHDVIFPDVVQTESVTFTYLEDEAETHQYRLTHAGLSEASLDRAASRERIAQARDRWRELV